MKTTRVALAAAVLLIALTGCSAGASEDVESAPTSTPSATETVEPLSVDEAPAAPSASEAEVAFLADLRPQLKNITDATDEQLLLAGHQSCDLYAAGTPRKAQQLVEGEQADEFGNFRDSNAIAVWAAIHFCPEFKDF